jgi:hypothetical protein
MVFHRERRRAAAGLPPGVVWCKGTVVGATVVVVGIVVAFGAGKLGGATRPAAGAAVEPLAHGGAPDVVTAPPSPSVLPVVVSAPAATPVAGPPRGAVATLEPLAQMRMQATRLLRTPSAAPSPLLSGLRSLNINAKATTPLRLGLGPMLGLGSPMAGGGAGASAWTDGGQLDEGEKVEARKLLDAIGDMVASLQQKMEALERS